MGGSGGGMMGEAYGSGNGYGSWNGRGYDGKHRNLLRRMMGGSKQWKQLRDKDDGQFLRKRSSLVSSVNGDLLWTIYKTLKVGSRFCDDSE